MDLWKPRSWKLIGCDTFSGDYYSIPGTYATEEAARRAARQRLRQLEKEQPSEQSGGQDGIQDQVYVCGPGGVQYRYRDNALASDP